MRPPGKPLVGASGGGEKFLRICDEAGYFLAELEAAGRLQVRIKESLALGIKLADNIRRSWRENLKGIPFIALNGIGESVLDSRGDSFKDKLRLMKDRVVRGESLQIAETYDVDGVEPNHKDSEFEGIVVVKPDKIQQLTRTLFSSTSMSNENLLKMQRERKIWWMKVC